MFKMQKLDTQKCNNIKGRLKQDPHYICPVCADEHRREKIVEDKLQIKVKADVMLDCVENFCYLGNEILARGGRRKRVETE